MNQNSSAQSHSRAAKTGESAHTVDKLSVISEWVAPIIGWVAVVALSLAIAGFLLGEA